MPVKVKGIEDIDFVMRRDRYGKNRRRKPTREDLMKIKGSCDRAQEASDEIRALTGAYLDDGSPAHPVAPTRFRQALATKLDETRPEPKKTQRKAAPKRKRAPITKAEIAVITPREAFRMSGAELTADGSEVALAEIARRKAKRTA